MTSSRAIFALFACLAAGAQTQTAPPPAKPKPYVNSFPVSNAPASRGVNLNAQNTGGLRLLQSKPTNAAKPATTTPSSAPPRAATPATPKPQTVVHPTVPRASTSSLLDKIQTPVIAPTHSYAPAQKTRAGETVFPAAPMKTPAVAAPVTAMPAKPKPQAPPAVKASIAPTFTAPASTKPAATAPAPKGQTAPASASNTAPSGPFNRGIIVLDPAHGGVDTGSRITDSLAEKDVTLALAFKLRSLLQARGFAVVLTRDNDSASEPNNPGTPLSLDDRAGLANHPHAVACLLLHATASGTGVHLYRSELAPARLEAANPGWLTAQAPWVDASSALEDKLSEALERSHIPHVASAASVRPVDSLACPALVVELAPQDAGDAATANDGNYQSKVAEAMAGALVFWRNQAQPPARAVPPPATAGSGGTQ